ncbi:DUF4388 domain-containing protein [Desulfuromonas sp. AOP6]|uniref:DUF4388 domain-containing protein n=1 Tax=Desulfuromonas sp. AOP6 TaxID=1566351 RepID=UPI001280A9BB|nr:DUF4388 domain-containing protein [Desulfuromonas sp. AOP6]BCA80023.1 hypothetical protein AOP6_1810 [Desulfuromonas sp. AOP6]
MSLVGNLEDLGLGEILQIVSLSRKSGVLSLHSRGRQGWIYFKNGQVIRAASSTVPENLGDLLVRSGVVSLDILDAALERQRQSGGLLRLGALLTEHFRIAAVDIENVVRKQIEKLVYGFFGWTEGTFAFELREPETLGETRVDPLQFMLDQGLNPQWLAMEGSRLLDERRRQEQAGQEKDENFLWGDDSDSPQAGPLSEVSRLAPATGTAEGDESGPVLYNHSCHGIDNPSRLVNFGAELMAELGEETLGVASKGPESPGLRLLKGMLQELNNPSLGGGVILLVLRFASELMNRAVIFLVKEDEIVGLGQFGIAAGESADLRVRRMKVSRTEPSVFHRVIEGKIVEKVPLGTGYWDTYLKDQLGGDSPVEVFLGPIISDGMVVAVLYGDNLPEKRPVGDTEALEIFLSQAGLAMERTLADRRGHSKNAG